MAFEKKISVEKNWLGIFKLVVKVVKVLGSKVQHKYIS